MSTSHLFQSTPIHSADESTSYEEDSSSQEDDALVPTSAMSTSPPVPSLVFDSSDGSTSSEEDFPPDIDDVYRMIEHGRDDSETGEEDSSSESSSEDDAPTIVNHSRSNSVNWQGNTSSAVNLRDISNPMLRKSTTLTTAQERTKRNMFGITNTEFVRIDITDPVLYIALYSTGDAPSEVDDYHWAFIVGPSREDATSKGTSYSMEPRQAPGEKHPCGGEWCWLYNQSTVPLRGQSALLARLMVAEIADMDLWQAVVLRWGSKVCMQEHVEWMSVRWVQNVLQDLDEEEGCLGRRMESFDSVEAEGRWLAEKEEAKRKGFCLLDTKITTRVLFERERATSLSAATVDIVIENPVLYVAVYKTDCAPRDSQQWTFLIGPSVETAQSEGVRCAVEIHLDSNGWEMWVYNQTVVPLWYEDDLLARIMIAEIRNLAPLGAIMRNEEGTPMTEIATLAGDMALCSFCSNAWVWEKLELLARKPECLERSFNALETLEKAGCRFSVTRRQIAIEELFERFRSKDARKTERTFPAIELKSLNFVDGWEEPSDDEDDLIVSPNVERGQTITTSRFVQVATGVLGAAALETRERVAEWDQYLKWCEQEREAVVEPEGSEIALLSPLRMGFEHENEAVEEDEAQTESEGGVDGDDEDEEESEESDESDEEDEDEDDDEDEEEEEEEEEEDSGSGDEDKEDSDEDSGEDDEGDEAHAGALNTLKRVPATTSSA